MKPLTIAIIATLVVAGAVFGYLYYQRMSNDVTVVQHTGEGSTPVPPSGASESWRLRDYDNNEDHSTHRGNIGT